MSWSKESAAAGLGGFTPREAALGAFMLEDFQHMADPLPDPDKEYGDLIHIIEVSTVLSNVNKFRNYVERVENLLPNCICFSCSQKK